MFRSKISDEIKRESLAIYDDNDENLNKIDDKEEKERKKKAEKYVQSSFNNFIFHFKNGEQALQKDIKNCKKMDIHSDSRDFIWFFFLDILPYNDPSIWKKIMTEQRCIYDSLKKELITKEINDFIETKKIKDKYSLYYKFKEILTNEDYFILDLIKVDVNRTFQKIELFRLDKIQKVLINILFIFAKKNKEIKYRQGMSELAAVFLYVLYKEQVLKPAFITGNETFLYYFLHSNNEFLEHDTYLMFSNFMLKGFLTFFRYSDEIYRDGQLSELESEQKRLLTKNEIINSKDSELKKRIFLLYYNKLPILDKNLYTYMSEKVDPEVFLLKWYICIFTREFPINQVVHLWDLILLYEYINQNLLNKDKNAINNIKNKIDNKINNNEIKEQENFNSNDNLKILNDIITDKNNNINNIDNSNNKEELDIKNNNKEELDIKNNNNNDNEEELNIKNKNNIILEDNKTNNNKEELNTKNNNNKNIISDENKNKDNIYDYDLDKKFCFIDYITLSMILKIKNLILKKKSSSELIAFLMKYPQDINLEDICQKALDIYYKFNPNVKI